MHLPLSQLLATGRSPAVLVANRRGELIDFARFRADIAHNSARLASVNCRLGAPICSDSYWFIVGFLALCHAGAKIVMPANTQPGTLASLADMNDLLLLDGATGLSGTFRLEDGSSEAPELRPFQPDDLAIVFFTSGSTGSPKKITRTIRDLEHEVKLVSPVLNEDCSDRLVSGTVSHQHVYGLLFRLLWPLSCGRPFSTVTHEVWETVLEELEPGGILVTSPAHLSRMAGIAPLESTKMPAQVLSAGAPLLPEVAHDAAEILGVYPTEIFGSTETGACAVRETETGDAPWNPLPGVCFDRTAEGTLRIQSPALPKDVWVKTADRVDLQPNGGFRFQGRADRVVKIEGKRISLPEVEKQLSAMPWVDRAAVTVVQSGTNRLAAVVVASPAGAEKLSEMGNFRFGRLLRRELTETQESAGLPRLWRFVDALPVNDMGKRRDQDLQGLFAETRPS